MHPDIAPRVRGKSIYIQNDNGSTYLLVHTTISGRRADEVGMFLEIISGGAIRPTSDHVLIKKRTGEVVATLTSDTVVHGGVYILKANTPINFTYASEPPRLFPPSRTTIRVSSPAPSRPGSPRITSESRQDCLERDMRFRESIVQRDRFCIVTGTTSLHRLRGCHIIPCSWKENQLVGALPGAVRDHIQEELGPAGVDDARNGFLATRELHDDFDRGEWGVVCLEGRLCFFGISAEYNASAYHRRPLRLPEGSFPDGEPLATQFPDPILWWHHFQCAVFRHMRGGGEIDEHDTSDEFNRSMAELTAELETIDAELGHLEGVFGDSLRKLRSDVVKEYYGRVDTYGIPANVPDAYL
ncbi:hypothetical protein BC832DRAFT_543385 [Gaertneriomyces semiglobifer]|nr:hypothetical protein BC832DRAFT_543385 [Gaertneriomyces semiglobifer]